MRTVFLALTALIAMLFVLADLTEGATKEGLVVSATVLCFGWFAMVAVFGPKELKQHG